MLEKSRDDEDADDENANKPFSLSLSLFLLVILLNYCHEEYSLWRTSTFMQTIIHDYHHH